MEDVLHDVFGGIKTIVDGEVEGGSVEVSAPWRWERWAVNLYGKGIEMLDSDGKMAAIQRDVEQLRSAVGEGPTPEFPVFRFSYTAQDNEIWFHVKMAEDGSGCSYNLGKHSNHIAGRTAMKLVELFPKETSPKPVPPQSIGKLTVSVETTEKPAFWFSKGTGGIVYLCSRTACGKDTRTSLGNGAEQISTLPNLFSVGAPVLLEPASVETTSLGLGKQVGGDHYQMPIQHFEFVAANNIPYAEATAMKYLCRHRKKNKHQDLDKAIHYILMLRAQAYPDAPPWVNPMEAT
jgi:hypothetical protein